MKSNRMNYIKTCGISALVLMFAWTNGTYAQGTAIAPSPVPDSGVKAEKTALKPIKNTFSGNWVMDEPTVMVDQQGSFAFTLGHRFGTFANGYSDCFGLFNPGNVRLGFNYSPCDQANLGFGFSGNNLVWDGNLKVALIKQSKEGGWPLSVTYYGDMAIDTRDNKVANYYNTGDRLSYFHELMIARKITPQLSVQAAISLSHFNNVAGSMDSTGAISSLMENDNWSVSFAGKYMFTDRTGIIVTYSQPLTQNYTNNPMPNIGFGIETITSGHVFQVFVQNCQFIIPQYDNTFNQNDFHQIGQWCIGFNLSRIWNFHKSAAE